MKTAKFTISVMAFLLTASLLLAGCADDSVSTSALSSAFAPTSSNSSSTSDASAKPGTSPTNPSSDVDLKTLADTIYSSLPEIKFPTLITDTLDPSDQNRFRYIFGIDPPTTVLSALASEPMIGSLPYTMALLKLDDTADIANIASSIERGVDPAKWICVTASTVKTAYQGNIILLIMDNDGGRANAVIEGFYRAMQ